MITKRDITILDCGYDNRNNITLDETDFDNSNHKIFGKLEQSYFKIKSDGSSLLKIQTILSGVQINDTVEFEMMYRNNDDNCRCYLSLSANNGQSSNVIQYGMKEVVLKNSNNKWTKIKGILPSSSGQLVSNSYHGTAFLLGFENENNGAIEIRNLKLTIDSANSINYINEIVSQKTNLVFENKYKDDYYKLNKLGNNLASYNMLNISSGDFSWDSASNSLKLSKTLGNYQGNVITTQLSYEEPYINNNKYIVVKLNYKLLSGEPKIFVSSMANINVQKEIIDIPLSSDFITKYFIIPINTWATKQDIINVYVGYLNKSTSEGIMYIKEFTCYNNIFTNLSVTSKNTDFLTVEQLFGGDNENGWQKTQDGYFVQWITKSADISSFVNVKNGLYSGDVTFNNISSFSSLQPYNYLINIIDTGLENLTLTTTLKSTNNIGCNVRVISSSNLGTVKIRVTGIGRWK